MNLIQEYMELTQNCASTNYGDKKSVRLHNKSVGRMYEIAKRIGHEQTTTETVDDFAGLLDVTQNKTNLWAAIHLLELIPANKDLERKALGIIEQVAKGNSAESTGFKIWLENYRKK